MTKLYVGNLSFDTTEESLRALFAQHGAVESAKLISDRDTGRPRGSRAIQALNGKEFEGRALKVNEAREASRSGGGARSGGGRRY
jgi:cold-inducible RNA-binding protein